MRGVFLFLLFIPILTIAQKKKITLEDIYKKGIFRGEYVPGFASEDNSSLIDPSLKGKAFNNKKGDNILKTQEEKNMYK